MVLHTFLFTVVISHVLNLIYYQLIHMRYYHFVMYEHYTYWYMETLLLAVLCIFGMKSYLEAAFTDPGKLKDYDIPMELDELRDIDDGDEEAHFSTCSMCNVVKVWYSHHCMVCGHCVIRMDHHCRKIHFF